MARDQKANEQRAAEQAGEAESQAAPDTSSTSDVWHYRRGTGDAPGRFLDARPPPPAVR
jgi:hypothetical protein